MTSQEAEVFTDKFLEDFFDEDKKSDEKTLMANEFFSQVKGIDLEWLDDDAIEGIIYCVQSYLRGHAQDSTVAAIDIAKRLVDRELNTSASDEDDIVEQLLDAFFLLSGHDEEKAKMLKKIEDDCQTHEKFRHWMGRRLFDLQSKKRITQCCSCANKLGPNKDYSEKECAEVSIPSCESKGDRVMMFCRNHYGEGYFGLFD